MSTTPIDLDGSFGEGGGQILRTSLALSLITGKPFHLRNVRAGRAKPGLQPQHLASVRAAAAISGAHLRGASIGSTDLEFMPGPVTPGKYRFDIGTAGATGLVLHTVYLPLAYRTQAPSELTLTGGTHVQTSPCFDFLDVTWRGYLGLCGLNLSLKLLRPGFYPRGGGTVVAHVQSAERLTGVRLGARRAVEVRGVSAVAGLPEEIARRQARRVVKRLEQADIEAEVDVETWDGGPGTVLVLELNTVPVRTVFFAPGARGKPAERVADDAFDEIMAYLHASDALVDAHSADQLILPLALADGPSEYRVGAVTRHLTTNVAVIQRFLDREILCEGNEGEAGTVRVT
jgi:RNA 3'-terminal phosphate cyclase (ATP)